MGVGGGVLLIHAHDLTHQIRHGAGDSDIQALVGKPFCLLIPMSSDPTDTILALVSWRPWRLCLRSARIRIPIVRVVWRVAGRWHGRRHTRKLHLNTAVRRDDRCIEVGSL